jgi:hypothetical protein
MRSQQRLVKGPESVADTLLHTHSNYGGGTTLQRVIGCKNGQVRRNAPSSWSSRSSSSQHLK